MRQIRALARERWRLATASILILVAILLAAWTFIGRDSVAAPAVDTPADEQGVFVDSLPSGDTATPEQAPETQPTPAAFAVVYISGAIQHPDVYQVPANARVKDVVLAAGGLTEDAAVDRVNLAEHVADAQHIHIPRQGENPPDMAASGESAPAAGQETALNINTASAADLDGLPGIGQSIAQRIVEYRTTNGPFQSVEDLQKVKGVGPALFAKIASLITVGP